MQKLVGIFALAPSQFGPAHANRDKPILESESRERHSSSLPVCCRSDMLTLQHLLPVDQQHPDAHALASCGAFPGNSLMLLGPASR